MTSRSTSYKQYKNKIGAVEEFKNINQRLILFQ
jgi:hypothetical protein